MTPHHTVSPEMAQRCWDGDEATVLTGVQQCLGCRHRARPWTDRGNARKTDRNSRPACCPPSLWSPAPQGGLSICLPPCLPWTGGVHKYLPSTLGSETDFSQRDNKNPQVSWTAGLRTAHSMGGQGKWTASQLANRGLRLLEADGDEGGASSLQNLPS